MVSMDVVFMSVVVMGASSILAAIGLALSVDTSQRPAVVWVIVQLMRIAFLTAAAMAALLALYRVNWISLA